MTHLDLPVQIRRPGIHPGDGPEALSDTASASVLEWFLNIVPVSLRSKTLEKGLMEGNATTQSSSHTASRGESPLGLMRKDGEIRLDTRWIRVLSMVRARGKKWGATPANFSSAHGSPQREGCIPVRQVGFGTSDSASRGGPGRCRRDICGRCTIQDSDLRLGRGVDVRLRRNSPNFRVFTKFVCFGSTTGSTRRRDERTISWREDFGETAVEEIPEGGKQGWRRGGQIT
ncbi:hypothetical protein B0H11DRAFT_1943762 [Mycena galericulata]|nr:hypothetical protein B0H11DRAFT_1943762 [Mycena galericulata]